MRIYDGRESFYQWDLNQKITSDEFVVGDKIHFFNMRQSNALVVKAYELDGQIVADVPNILLQSAFPITAWKYVYDEHSAQTIMEDTFVVEQRPQPYDYFYTETELYELRKEVDTLVVEANKAVAQLQNGLDNAAEALELATTAEKTSSQNEQARVTAEEQRQLAENERVSAEDDRCDAETERVEAETIRADAETQRNLDEETRLNNELTRSLAENERIINENNRLSAETTRGNAESERVSNESTRKTNETKRIDSESGRVIAENLRKTAESQRASAESERLSAETHRDEAEQERIANEELRKANFESLPNNIGNAIKATENGEVIRVDDVSPIEHTVKAKVSGKNLISFDKPLDINSTYHSWSVNPNHKTVTMSITDKDTSVDIMGMYLGLCGNGINGNGGVIWLVERGEIKRTTCTITDYEYVSIYKDESKDGVATALSSRFNIQVEYGDTATEYEPYIDPSTVTVTRCGKNLWYPFVKDKTFSNGSYIKVNEDGSFLMHQAGDDITISYEITLPAGDYCISNGSMKGTDQLPYIYISYGENYFYQKRKFTLAETTKCKLTVYCWREFVGDYMFYPLLERGTEYTNFEPCDSASYTPESDGLVDVTSFAPTMTLFTDTPGVTIECEYNQDTNKALGAVKDDIRTLDDTVAQIILNGGSNGETIVVVQTTGDSETAVMSQKAVTEAINAAIGEALEDEY